jgi:hypothetical protein
VASRLRGITDAIVVDEETGYLCKAGNPREFGERIAELIGKPELLKQMSRASLERVKEKFVARRMAEDYIKLFSEIGKSICRTQKGLTMEQFQIYNKGYNKTWLSWTPKWLKNMLRTFQARFRG